MISNFRQGALDTAVADGQSAFRAGQAWPAVTLPKTRQKLPPPTLTISSGVKPWSSISPATAWKNPPGQALLVPWPTRGDSRSVSVPMPAWSIPHRVHHRLDAFHEILQRVGQVSPHTDHAAGIGHDLCVFFADQPWLHHFRHLRVSAGSAVEAGVGHNHRLRSHLQRGQRRLVAGVSEVHYDPQSIALLHDLCAKSGQTPEVSGGRICVAQGRHHVVSLVKQLQVPRTAVVRLFHPVQVPLNEVCSFDRLDSRFEPAGIAAILRSHGFCAIEDINFQEIASRFGCAVQGLAPGHAGVHVIHAKH
jgi:hypothetical protein